MRLTSVLAALLSTAALSCHDDYAHRPIFAVEASGGTGFGENVRNHLRSNKDCGPVVVAATERLIAAHQMAELSREVSKDRALVHFQSPRDRRTYFEVLYRHDPDRFIARLSFDLLTPSGTVLDPSTILSPEQVEDFHTALKDAMDCP